MQSTLKKFIFGISAVTLTKVFAFRMSFLIETGSINIYTSNLFLI